MNSRARSRSGGLLVMQSVHSSLADRKMELGAVAGYHFSQNRQQKSENTAHSENFRACSIDRDTRDELNK